MSKSSMLVVPSPAPGAATMGPPTPASCMVDGLRLIEKVGAEERCKSGFSNCFGLLSIRTIHRLCVLSWYGHNIMEQVTMKTRLGGTTGAAAWCNI